MLVTDSESSQPDRFRLRLTLLMLLTILPALGLAVYRGFEERRSGREQAREQAILLARLAASDQEHLVDSTRDVLAPLGNITIINHTNSAFWTQNFKNLLVLQPQYINFGLAETNGTVFASAVPPETSANYSNRTFFAKVAKTRSFSVGDLEIDPVTKRRTLSFGYPVLNETGTLTRVLFNTIDLSLIRDLAAHSKLPEKSVLLIYDQSGNILARSPDANTRSGPSGAHPALFQAISGQSLGTIELTDLDGVRRLYAFASPHEAGAGGPFAAVGFPSELIYANANKTLFRNLAFLTLVALGALLAAQYYAHRYVLHPLEALMTAARRLAAGDLSARAGLKKGVELYHLAQSFNEMAQTLELTVSKLEEKNSQITAAEAKFRTLIEQSLVGIYVIQDDRFVYVNPKMPEIFGVSTEQLTTKPIYDFIFSEDREIVRANIRKRLEGTAKSIRYTLGILHGGGERRYVEVHGSRADYEGRAAIMGTMLDITERKRAEAELTNERAMLVQRVEERTAELSAANHQLAQGSKLKDEFLANMSHELRTPLNAILGLSEALLEQISGTLTARQIKSITTISNSGTHLLSLINDILDLSKVEAGKLELNSTAIDVPEFCQACLAFVRMQAMHKHIGIAFENDGHVPVLNADAKRLKQIIVNLLTNAVKFTPDGGRIGLSVTGPPEGDAVSFTVWDTGIGIAPDDRAKLFKAFSQIDSGLSRSQEGTGLGLALVARLTELHGGSVTLESGPDAGSRFIVTLPRGKSPVRAPEARDESDRRGYERALVIEDDLTAGEMIMRYLTQLGINSVLHARGDEAMAVVLKERPDFIVLDVLLPNDSGWVVLTRLKEHSETRDIPVVVLSVLDEPKKSVALGAVAHFTKPVTREQLAAFLQRPAVRRASHAELSSSDDRVQGPVILLAEDNEANVQTIGGYLEDKGYDMHYANNGLRALEIAREFRPACILMDIQMPVMDGLTAINEIRSDAQLKSIPVFALTALAMPGDRERCLAAGATEYMSKPVSLKALAGLLTRYVAQQAKSTAVTESGE